MDPLQVFFLALVEGVTEFLPISSSAHLIILPRLVGWHDQGVAFDLALHVGVLVAVIVYFYKQILRLIVDGVASTITLSKVGEGGLAWNLILATLPAAILGYLLIDAIDSHLRSLNVIIATTIGYALLMIVAEVWQPRKRVYVANPSWRQALLIGCAQAVSLIPGTSRSGATITMGLFCGLDHRSATQFSFLLAIPITTLAAGAKIFDLAVSVQTFPIADFVLGAAISCVTAFVVIHWFLILVKKLGLWPFIVYRLGLGFVLLLVF